MKQVQECHLKGLLLLYAGKEENNERFPRMTKIITFVLTPLRLTLFCFQCLIMDCGLKSIHTANFRMLIAAIQTVIIPITAPAILDTALIVTLKLFSFAQLW